MEIITSAVRPIPPAWADIPNLTLVISVDGPREEHDARRKPATYDRILKHIEGHEVVDEFEMAEIEGNEKLNQSIKRGLKDAKPLRGCFV